MNTIQNKQWGIMAGLMLAMAATRFNHFGSSVALPDASLAVFFLGGLYLAKFHKSLWIFAALLAEAALVDYYAIGLQGASDWCVTPAYGFLGVAYAAMWFAGRWIAPHHNLGKTSLMAIFATATLASASAFVISNASFFLFSGRYAEMSAAEYTSRVAQYFGSYVSVALLYVACAVAAQIIYTLLKGKAQRDSHAA